jgi:hypothetical protein
MTEYESQAKSMMRRICYLTIASVSAAGEPWNSPVYTSFDNEANFYWTSAPESRHSRNITETESVALVVYDSTVPEGTGVGALYMEAMARPLDDLKHIRTARALLRSRVELYDGTEDCTQYLEGGVRRVYKATPNAAWVNTWQDGIDLRAPIPLDALRNNVNW